MKSRATKKDTELAEYLRRNTLHCASVGAAANTIAAMNRLSRLQNRPQWLWELLAGIAERAERVSKEMAAHRDEI